MKTLFYGLAAALLLLLVGCSTPAARISSNQAAFDSWPADVREKVGLGKVAVGFTPEMVLVALGEADRKSTRTTAAGTVEVWSYFDHGPHFSFGLGMASGGRHSAVGGGVAVGDQGFHDDEILRVIFDGGRVAAIESRR